MGGSKYNPYHDELGLFTTPDRAVSPGSGTSDGRVRVAQARRPSSTVRIGGQEVDATPAEIMRLDNAKSAAVEGFLQKWREAVSESGHLRPDIRFYFMTDERLEEFSKFMKQLKARAAKN